MGTRYELIYDHVVKTKSMFYIRILNIKTIAIVSHKDSDDDSENSVSVRCAACVVTYPVHDSLLWLLFIMASLKNRCAQRQSFDETCILSEHV